jgi:ubiquitin C-terminal hydrolase
MESMIRHESAELLDDSIVPPTIKSSPHGSPKRKTSKVIRSPAVMPSMGSGAQPAITLEQCLREHTREEYLDEANAWYCNVCKKHQCAKKVTKFWGPRLPEVLVLVLKRFEFRDVSSLVGRSGICHREKIETFVDFPLEGLDIGPYCGDRASSEAWMPNDGDCREGRLESADLLSEYCSQRTVYDLFAGKSVV